LGQRVKVTASVLGPKVLYGEVREIYPMTVEKQSKIISARFVFAWKLYLNLCNELNKLPR